jgi:acetolactate synthase-1/3 small subunit
MHKLVNVLRVSELEPGEAVERELALITVAAAAERAPSCCRSRTSSGARRRRRPGRDRLRVVGEPDELDSFEELVRPHGIKELARTGRIGLARARGPQRPSSSSSH